MAKFEIKMNSTDPSLAVQFIDSVGSAINLETASNIYFKMSTNDNQYTPVFSGAAVISSGTGIGSTTGNVQYNWTASDTNRSGLFLGEFSTTFSDSSILTLPSDDSLIIKINKDYD